jgi:asparagine synthase (glutamine-hydrolysing)
LFLSSGIDSASLLALSTEVAGQPVDTFSVGYRGTRSSGYPDDETGQARDLAAHFHAHHHELLLSAEDWWTALLPSIAAQEEPNADPAVVSLFALSALASAHVKVVLSGLGGDEVFGGYGFHRRLPMRLRQGEWLRRRAPGVARTWGTGGAWDIAEAAYPSLRRRRVLVALLAPVIELRTLGRPEDEALRRRMSHDGLVSSERLRADLYDPAGMAPSLESHYKEASFAELLRLTNALDPADLVQQLWLQVWLPGSGLLALDKVTMAHSLEGRVPYFDPALMTFLFQIPAAVRLRGNKPLLRQAMRNDLPQRILRRSKRPFSTPIGCWFDHELADQVQAVLLDPRCLGRAWFKPRALANLVRKHFAREADYTEILFRLLVFELWQQALIDSPSRASETSSGAPS